jgi:hypothetical protein
MAQQTAVDWLLKEQYDLNMEDGLSKRQYLGRRIRNQRKAREMFMQQILDAYRNGFAEAIKLKEASIKYIHKESEQYFNETYNP